MVAGPFKGIKIQGIILFSVPGCETVGPYGLKRVTLVGLSTVFPIFPFSLTG